MTALQDWLELAELREGPVFRGVNRHGQVSDARLTAQVVALMVKRSLAAAGLDSALYSGHSLGAGLVTAAKKKGVDDADIMRLTGASFAKDAARVRPTGEAVGEPRQRALGACRCR